MRKCVLIYDDDTEILAVCRAILDQHDYRVEALTSCENIILDIERLGPHIILMDLWIPRIGGEHAIRLMRENSRTSHIPVILFSANDEIEKISNRVQATAFLRKPFDITNFRKIIEAHIL